MGCEAGVAGVAREAGVAGVGCEAGVAGVGTTSVQRGLGGVGGDPQCSTGPGLSGLTSAATGRRSRKSRATVRSSAESVACAAGERYVAASSRRFVDSPNPCTMTVTFSCNATTARWGVGLPGCAAPSSIHVLSTGQVWPRAAPAPSRRATCAETRRMAGATCCSVARSESWRHGVASAVIAVSFRLAPSLEVLRMASQCRSMNSTQGATVSGRHGTQLGARPSTRFSSRRATSRSSCMACRSVVPRGGMRCRQGGWVGGILVP